MIKPKFGVVTESFTIVLDCLKMVIQPSTIQFYLQVPLMYWYIIISIII